MLHNLLAFQHTKKLMENLASGDLTEDGAEDNRNMGPLDHLVQRTIRGLRPLIRVIDNAAARLLVRMDELGSTTGSVTEHLEETGGIVRETASRLRASEKEARQAEQSLNAILEGLNEMSGLLDSGSLPPEERLRLQMALDHLSALSDRLTGSMHRHSEGLDEAVSGLNRAIRSADAHSSKMEEIQSLSKDVVACGLSLRSAVSQFKLPAVGPGGAFQSAAQDWIESALQVRVMMIKVFDITDTAMLDPWYLELRQKEARLNQSFQKLHQMLRRAEDQDTFEVLVRYWEAYVFARNKNVRLLFEGEFVRAKEGVMNEARGRFKQSMELMYQWLEDSYRQTGRDRLMRTAAAGSRDETELA